MQLSSFEHPPTAQKTSCQMVERLVPSLGIIEQTRQAGLNAITFCTFDDFAQSRNKARVYCVGRNAS